MFTRLLGARLPLPSLCSVCRTWNRYAVCASCQHDLGPVVRRCPSCALPLAPGIGLCAHCTEHGHSPMAQACARVNYQWPWTHLVRQWKFHQHSAWSAEWARHLLQDPQIERALKQSHIWIPIPLAPERLVERGFNQAWELCKHLHPHAPQSQLMPDALVRRSTQRLQHQLDRMQRRIHAQQALALNPLQAPALRGQRVVLIDDVMTTGATLYAAAEHVLRAGAAQVSSVVIARTPQATTTLRDVSPQDEAMLLS
jgi:ComF family protein